MGVNVQNEFEGKKKHGNRISFWLFTGAIVLTIGILFFVCFNLFDLGGRLSGQTLPVNGDGVSNALSEFEQLRQDELAELQRRAEMEEALNVNTIYDNISVNGIDISGLTKTDAIAKLEAEILLVTQNMEILFTYGENKHTVPFSEFDVKYTIEEAVNEAYEYARTGTILERFTEMMEIKMRGIDIKAEYSYDEERIPIVLQRFLQYDIAPSEPKLSRERGIFSVSAGANGQKVDLDSMAVAVKGFLDTKTAGVVNITVTPVTTVYSAVDFAKATDRMGTFTTYFTPNDVNRNQNIITAAAHINNYVVYPDEIFSTNRAFGEVTYANGYRMAGTYLNGKVVDGMGGGMCQVSSTLYMALLYAELQIVERTNHSMKVGYMDWGFDATLAGDYLDLKFKNNTNYPITIETIMTSTSLTVNIYGYETRSAGRSLRFENALITTTPPAAALITEDPTLPLNSTVVDIQEKTGYQYKLYKFVYENGVLVDTVTINTSTYRSVRGEIRVGTAPLPDIPQVTN